MLFFVNYQPPRRPEFTNLEFIQFMKMNRYLLIGFPILLFLFSTSVYSQVKIKAPTDKVKEILYDKAPVSGEIRVGVMILTGGKEISPGYIYTKLPEDHRDFSQNKLFVILSSKDGLYKCSMELDLSDITWQETGVIEWKTNYSTQLSKYKAEDVAILTKYGKSWDSKDSKFVISSWSKNFDNDISVFLNADYKPRILVEDPGKNPAYCDCEKIESGPNVTFNYHCKIELEKLKGSPNVIVQQKVKRLGTFTIRNYDLPLIK